MQLTSRSASARCSQTTWRRRSACNGSAASGWLLRLLLVALLLIGTAPVTQPAYAQPSSDKPAVVELTEAEADSVLRRIEHLEIDLWECEQRAALDSLYYEERLALQHGAYEYMLDAYKEERPGWLQRFLSQPVVWLAVGMYLGVRAGD